MKILNLYFNNIKSLQGEHRLDFTQPPLSTASVFAITGPNGSGKSSLLDVLTLALFGETYRFDKPAEQVMTKGCAACFAQVEFLLAGQRYRAVWSAQRKDGKPEAEIQPVEMTLFHLQAESEVLLADNPAAVRKQILTLTGLDLHKFNQSMVLAQGEFAAFLNALDSERMDILEKIIGEDIYQQQRDAIKARHKTAKQQVELLQQDIDATPVLDQDAVDASLHDLDDFKLQNTEFQQQRQELAQQLEQARTLSALEHELQTLSQQKQTIEQACDALQKRLTELDALSVAASFKDELAIYQQQKSQLENAQRQLNQFQQEISSLQRQISEMQGDDVDVSTLDIAQQQQKVAEIRQQLAELKQNLPQENALLQSVANQLAEKKSALEYTENWLQEHQKDKVLLDDFPEIGKFKSLRQEIAKLEENQKKQGKWTKNVTANIKKTKGLIKDTNKTIKLLQQKLAKTEQTIKDITHGKSFEELESLKLEQQERVDDFLELYDLAKVNAKLNKKGIFAFFAERKQEKLDIDEQKLEEEAHLLELEIAKEENILRMLEKAAEYETLLKRLEKFRDKLEEGRPCPLCGSIHHPYVSKPPKIEDSRKALSDQKLKIKELKTRSVALNVQVKEAKRLQEKEAHKGEKLQEVMAQWHVLANRLNIGSRVSIDDVGRIKSLLKHEKSELTEINQLIRRCTKLHVQIEKIQADIAQNEHALQRLQHELDELNAEWNNRPREVVELEKALEQRKDELKALQKQLVEQLSQAGETLPEPGEEDSCFERLNQRRMEYQTRQARIKILRQDIAELEEKLNFCQEDVDQLNQQLNEYTRQLNKEESVGLQLALVEKQKLLAEKERQVEQQQQTLQQVQQQLAERVKETPLQNIDALIDALKKLDQHAELTQQLTQKQQELAQLTQTLEQREITLQQQKTQAADLKPEHELAEALKQLEQKIDIVQQEIQSTENKLAKHQTAQEKRAQLTEKLEQHQLTLAQVEKELALAQDDQGMAFRQHVQKMLIDKMLSASNRILEKISGRYYVRHVPSEQGFAMVIEDTRQNNVRRLPKTLSGGEGFVVSLALALALAESADNGHAIDSLFIDEGFGNLDEESLYLVMSTLENLNTQGKTVGIISHVEGVRKRVKTRIEMQKKADGHCSFQVLS